ncbi:glycoside hydrolase family 16 protein [Schizophyllum commune]|nr:glycoside hydrolase family 16 protein [Schizophyllum commune Loenen D]KAI5831983.1 glycoside hydrolase family 16 protein [Schizophyllum commune Tattone D]
MHGAFGLIDPDTPADVRTRKSYTDDGELQLIFSDEFNVDGRTFYPGDDPYWEAVDLHYWQTNNMEWYDPSAVTTENGSLAITLNDTPTKGMDYVGGMVQTWNKFCFTGGLVEAAVMLPGTNDVLGLWPAVWAMGNLGRAGFGASLDGMWPYTYDACDVGTVANQTKNGRPIAATRNGDPGHDNVLSYLPGQRLSRCTCPGEEHPGPMHSDGTYVGRAAPEIDIFEATVSDGTGFVSQSGQWAPFNEKYVWKNTSDTLKIYDKKVSSLNTYLGGAYQMATSVISQTNQECYYDGPDPCFAIYGFEYKEGFDDGYITWINDGKAAWTITSEGMGADTAVEISARPVPQEPLYLLANLGMSQNFGFVDVEHLQFPTKMLVDYIRVYQRSDAINIGCDPENFPTAAYIAKFPEAYTNPNLTTWHDDYGQVIPKNSFLDEC